jgi:hypothetical protein
MSKFICSLRRKQRRYLDYRGESFVSLLLTCPSVSTNTSIIPILSVSLERSSCGVFVPFVCGSVALNFKRGRNCVDVVSCRAIEHAIHSFEMNYYGIAIVPKVFSCSIISCLLIYYKL